MTYFDLLRQSYLDGDFSRLSVDDACRSELQKSYQDYSSKGYRFLIEPRGEMTETVTTLKDGTRRFTYSGTVCYAFEKNNFFFGGPDEEAKTMSKEEGVTSARFFFYVDPAGRVVGIDDEIAAPRIGKVGSRGDGLGEGKIVLGWIVVIVLMFAGVWAWLRYAL